MGEERVTKMEIDSGNLTGARLNGQIIETWGYSIVGDVLTHTFWDYRINKLTRNEFVLSQLVWDWTSPDKNYSSMRQQEWLFRPLVGYDKVLLQFFTLVSKIFMYSSRAAST